MQHKVNFLHFVLVFRHIIFIYIIHKPYIQFFHSSWNIVKLFQMTPYLAVISKQLEECCIVCLIYNPFNLLRCRSFVVSANICHCILPPARNWNRNRLTINQTQKAFESNSILSARFRCARHSALGVVSDRFTLYWTSANQKLFVPPGHLVTCPSASWRFPWLDTWNKSLRSGISQFDGRLSHCHLAGNGH